MPNTLLKSAFYAAVLAVCLPSAAQQTASFDSLDGTLLKALVFHPDATVIRPANLYLADNTLSTLDLEFLV